MVWETVLYLTGGVVTGEIARRIMIPTPFFYFLCVMFWPGVWAFCIAYNLYRIMKR